MAEKAMGFADRRSRTRTISARTQDRVPAKPWETGKFKSVTLYVGTRQAMEVK